MESWNRPAVLVMAFVFAFTCKGQFTPPSGEFYETLREKQEYFSVLRSQMTEEEFFQEGGEYAAFQRWLQFWQFRAPLGDRLNYDLLLKNYCDAHFTANGSYKSNSDPWHEIGPKGIANNMFGIGPVRHIAISKDNSEHMLCTSNSGGLFHTSDANATCTWHNGGTDLGLPRSGCSWADFYPGTTDNWYVLSGTRIAYLGGLYRTNNSGADWVRIADYTDLGGPNTDVLQFIFDRKLNFNGEHRLFLLTSLGMYVTDDPEATLPSWTPIQIIVPPSIPAFSSWAVDPNVLVYDIEYLASSAPTSTLCASMRFKLTNGSNTMHIWRFMLSTDDGETWTEAPNQPDIDPGIEWATVETSAASPTAFHCMVEKGSNSWVKLFDTTVNQAWPTLASNFNPDFGAGHTFGVDQFNANSLIVGDDLYDVNWYLNGAEVAYPYPPSPPAPRQYKYASTGHDDVEDIVGDPANPGIFWVANHGGVTRVNTNASPRTWEYKSEGLGVAEVWSMSTSQNKPDYVALGLYHQCNLITRTTYSEDWTPDWAYLNLYGDGTLALLDHKDANTLYYANQYGNWWRNDDSENSLTLGQDVSLGTNQYEYYAEGTLNRKQPNTLYRATKRPNGYTTVINNQGNSVQYLNHEIEILRSFDKGSTNHIISDFRNDWEVTRSGINEYLFDNERVWWLRSSPANPKHLYAGLLNWDWQNRIYRTTIADHPDAQQVIASWQDVPHPRRVALGTFIRQQPPVGFAMDPENEDFVYVAYASALFEDSDDFDSPFGIKMVYRLDLSNLSAFPQSGPFDCDGAYPCADLTMNLPNTTIDLDCFAYEQGSDGGLYLSTEVGTYFTNNKRIAAYNPSGAYVNPDDQSNTSGWVRLGGSLPHVSSRGLEINYNVNRIRTGLTGRGVWGHNLYCPEQSTYSETGTYGASAFLEAQQDIISEAIVPSSLKVDYRAGTEVRLTPGFRAVAGSRFHAFIHPCNATGNSFTVKGGTSGTGVEENYMEPRHNAPSLLLYPNPAHASLTIVCATLPDQAKAHARLFDTMGRMVLVQQLRGSTSVLDLSSLRGLFTVVVDIGSAQFTERVVIE